MWFINYELDSQCVPVPEGGGPIPEGGGLIVCNTLPTRMVPNSWNDKFSQSMCKAKQLCSILAESGQRQYAARFRVLQDILDYWAAGKEVTVVEQILPTSGELTFLFFLHSLFCSLQFCF